MLNVIQGFQLRVPVRDPQAYMTIVSPLFRCTYRSVSDQGGGNYAIVVPGTQTSQIPYGTYRYQVLDPDGLQEDGSLQVKVNYSIMEQGSEYRSEYQVLLQAIRNVLAGRATRAEYSITIDGKQIQYLGLDQLLKLEQYYEQKVAQERGEYKKGNQGRILYNCNRIRRFQ